MLRSASSTDLWYAASEAPLVTPWPANLAPIDPRRRAGAKGVGERLASPIIPEGLVTVSLIVFPIELKKLPKDPPSIACTAIFFRAGRPRRMRPYPCSPE